MSDKTIDFFLYILLTPIFLVAGMVFGIALKVLIEIIEYYFLSPKSNDTNLRFDSKRKQEIEKLLK